MLLWFFRIPHFHTGIDDVWLSTERELALGTGCPLGCRKIFLLWVTRSSLVVSGVNVNRVLSFGRKRTNDSRWVTFLPSFNRTRAQRYAGPSREIGASRKCVSSWVA